MKNKFKYLFTQIFGTLYATSDEIHQLFVAQRECHIRDVFIDSCGVAFGALIVLLIIHLHKKHKAKKLENIETVTE
jgi:VanZ family protein